MEKHNYLPYFLGGIIIGSILSFVFMAHLIKTKQAMSGQKKNKPTRESGLNNILSTGCEEDEEKYY